MLLRFSDFGTFQRSMVAICFCLKMTSFEILRLHIGFSVGLGILDPKHYTNRHCWRGVPAEGLATISQSVSHLEVVAEKHSVQLDKVLEGQAKLEGAIASLRRSIEVALHVMHDGSHSYFPDEVWRDGAPWLYARLRRGRKREKSKNRNSKRCCHVLWRGLAGQIPRF